MTEFWVDRYSSHFVTCPGGKTKGKSGLKGIVCGSGIACSCPDCHGTKVISPNEFEKHAHSRNKRPADYIYLENGNNLRAVLNACTNATLEALESIIQGMIGCTSSSAEQNVFCPICTSSISGEEMLCSSCKEISTHCALCRGHDFSTSEFGSRTIIFCDQAITPYEFELHAESLNRQPINFIFLENGNNLRVVLNACTNATLEAVESIILGMIGHTSSSAEQNVFCPTCTRSISGEIMLCSSCKEIRCALCWLGLHAS